MFHGLVSFFVFQLLLFAVASAFSLTIPAVVASGEPFTAFWTRTETDPRKYNLNILENGVLLAGPFPIGSKQLSGNFTVPGLFPVGTYVAQVSDDADGHILATSHEIQIVPLGGSNPETTASSPGATTSTANPNEGNLSSSARTANSPTSSARSQTQSTTFSSSAVSTPATSLSAISTSSTDSHVISGSSQTSTTTTSSLAGPTSGSPSTHTPDPRVNRFPIIIGVCAAVLVLVICVLLALWLLRRRRRRQREEQFEPAPTPFVLNPESYIQTRQRSSRVEKGLRKTRAPTSSTSSTYNSSIGSGTASTRFPDRRSRASRAVSSSDSLDQTLSSPSSGPGDLTDLHLPVPESSSQSGSVLASATLPVAFVVAEYQRLRLENQILRGDIPGFGSIYEDTLPPSYPGSGRASIMPLHTI